MVMASSPSIELPIFIDTNLGTHLAISASPDTTAGDLKNSVPIKTFFQGLKEAWFLRMDATRIEHMSNQVAPTDVIITRELKDPGKPYVPSAGGIMQCAQQGSLVEREFFKLAPYTPSLSDRCRNNIIPKPAFKKIESNRLPLPQDRNSEYLVAKLSDSISDASNATDCPKSGNHVIFECKRNVNDKAQRQNEQSTCLEDRPNELSMHIDSSNKGRKGGLKKKCNIKGVVGGHPKGVKMRIQESLVCNSDDENSLFENSCKKHVSVETRLEQIDSNDGENNKSCILRRKFRKKAKPCKYMRSRCILSVTDEGRNELIDGHHYKELENNGTDVNVERHTLVSVEEKGFPDETQKCQGVSLSSQTQIDCCGSVNEVVGREDGNSPSVSEIISVTGIITRYFPESDEVSTINSRAKSLSNMIACSKQIKDGRMQKLVDGCHVFIASDVEEYKSKTMTGKKLRKDEILPCPGTGVMGLDEKGSAMSHDTTAEHRANQDESCKADDTPQSAVKSPSMQPSLQWSVSPVTETPRSKLERNEVRKHVPTRNGLGISTPRGEVGKHVLLAANGLGISTSMQKLQTKCCSRMTKLSLLDSTALGRNVFEVSDGDD